MRATVRLRGLRSPALFPLAICCLLGCSRAAPTQAVGQEPAPAVHAAQVQAEPTPAAADCTLQTRLVPGIPGSPGHLVPSARNPNGQSELAAHMRMMEGDLLAARTAILRGGTVHPLLERHRKIRCAWPTRPDDRDEAFDASARRYLDAVAALERADASKAAAAYASVLGACRACHEHTCSGAIVAIDALALPPRAQPVP